jgi:ribosomal protein S3
MFGVRVKIMPPDAVFPDRIQIVEPTPTEEETEKPSEATQEKTQSVEEEKTEEASEEQEKPE